MHFPFGWSLIKFNRIYTLSNLHLLHSNRAFIDSIDQTECGMNEIKQGLNGCNWMQASCLSESECDFIRLDKVCSYVWKTRIENEHNWFVSAMVMDWNQTWHDWSQWNEMWCELSCLEVKKSKWSWLKWNKTFGHKFASISFSHPLVLDREQLHFESEWIQFDYLWGCQV